LYIDYKEKNTLRTRKLKPNVMTYKQKENKLGMLHAKYCPIWWSSSWEDHFFKHFPIHHYV